MKSTYTPRPFREYIPENTRRSTAQIQRDLNMMRPKNLNYRRSQYRREDRAWTCFQLSAIVAAISGLVWFLTHNPR